MQDVKKDTQNPLFLKEQKDLMTFYMNTDLIPIPENNESIHINRNGIELIVRPDCNQRCEYCYLTQHGKELYPDKVSKEEILHNIDLFLDYYYNERKNYSYLIELFAGDLFFDGLFFDVIKILKKYLIPIHQKHEDLREYMTTLCIPSNLSFVVEKPEYVPLVLEIKEELREYNIRLIFSWSSDGLYAVNSREKKELTQEYFEKINDFCEKVGAGVHPMVAPENVHNWIENYEWWLKLLSTREEHDFQPMMLEVRNNNWTDENIEDYKKLLTHMMEVRYSICDYDNKKLARHLFIGDAQDGTLKRMDNYDPLCLITKEPNNARTHISCSMQKLLHINCTNLSLVICHRLSYPVTTGIYFDVNEDNSKIIDFTPYNPDLYIQVRTMSTKMLPVCSSCEINDYCLKGCLGAQFEDSGEILLPIPSLCHFFKEKNKHLAFLYHKYNLFNIARDELNIDLEHYDWYVKQIGECDA